MDFKVEDVLFGPVSRNGAVEQIVRRIGEAIGAGVLSPGDRLPAEAELARKLNVAPMSVRQALAVLRQEGYLETRRGRDGGSFVKDTAIEKLRNVSKPWDLDGLNELTDWRRAVSGEAASLAAQRATAADIEALRAQERIAHDNTANPTKYRTCDARFHVLIAEVSRSRRLVAAEIKLQEELSALIAPVPGAELVRVTSGRGHSPIVVNIQNGETSAARESVIAHVEATRDWLIGLHLGGIDSSR
jgi:GntR family transcriptional repressor for pyruvate dehydrogenase complex